ncbi:MAG: hypothetical protein R2883_00800 [Caldisericia bacterium]
MEYANPLMFSAFFNGGRKNDIKTAFINSMIEAGRESIEFDIPSEEIGEFLIRFDQVFTTNYDPLYWSTMAILSKRMRRT